MLDLVALSKPVRHQREDFADEVLQSPPCRGPRVPLWSGVSGLSADLGAGCSGNLALTRLLQTMAHAGDCAARRLRTGRAFAVWADDALPWARVWLSPCRPAKASNSRVTAKWRTIHAAVRLQSDPSHEHPRYPPVDRCHQCLGKDSFARKLRHRPLKPSSLGTELYHNRRHVGNRQNSAQRRKRSQSSTNTDLSKRQLPVSTPPRPIPAINLLYGMAPCCDAGAE